MSALTQSPAWQALQGHARTMARIQMRDLFDREPGRFDRFSLQLGDILLDYSKNRITTKTLALLGELAREAELDRWIQRMFRGEPINTTEQRPALHVALRRPVDRPLELDGVDIMPKVAGELARIRDLAEALRDGRWLGFAGDRITDIVHIGIGGSHLGPQLVCRALRHLARPDLRLHFLSNVDGGPLAALLPRLNPATTLFLVVSKSFTTSETLTNAQTARRWFIEHGGSADAVSRHFIPVSANAAAVADFGLDPAAMFAMWDWVGGRFSLWSAAGLPIAIAVGFDNFAALLAGGARMDEHFRAAAPAANMPVVLALLGIWYVNFLGAETQAVLPYDEALEGLPPFLQQIEMESGGKRVTRDGEPVDYATAPVVWGAPGTDGQHAFMQALHQGTRLVPADFLVAIEPPHARLDHHRLLLANCLAQSEALMRGKSDAEAREELAVAGLAGPALQRSLAHRVCPGNRPSNTILYRRLDPVTLGSLIALYEHKSFVQGVLWRLNPFDQWGVELGKQLATGLLPAIEGSGDMTGRDGSTVGLVARCRSAGRNGG